MTYFSDREFGKRPPTDEDIGEPIWIGLRAIINHRIEGGSFGIDYPDSCEDGRGPFGTDRHGFEAVMRAEIPTLPEQVLTNRFFGNLGTVEILDLIEFCWRHVGDTIKGTYHTFFEHSHLSFDRELGKFKFAEEVNRIFERNGLAYTLNSDGRIERLGPPVLNEELVSAEFVTGNSELDNILESARRKYLNPREEIRRDALLELWDAWERLKTTGEGSHKNDQISSLLDDAAGSAYPKFRERLETDAKELTLIGNTHQIRHTEVSQEKVEKGEHIDYLFHRLFSMMWLILRSRTVTSTTLIQPFSDEDDDLPF